MCIPVELRGESDARQRAARLLSRAAGGPRRTHGFTLHETLIALTIVGLLGAGAVAFGRFLRNTHITTQVNTFIGHLYFARSEAIKRGRPVTVCKSDSGIACTEDSAWHDGWIVVTDDNGNGKLDGDDAVLRVGSKLEGGTTLTFNAWGVGTNKYVSYAPSGMTMKNGTFRFCNIDGPTYARAVILIQSGRVRTSSTGVTCP
jgi:type IV fimbrial biogenesis protein FimT